MDFAAPVFEPIKFVPSSQKESILDYPVVMVNAVAHERLETGGNHLCFYLAINNNEAVQLDMTPSYTVPGPRHLGGSKGVLVISHLAHGIPDRATEVVQLEVRSGLTVRDFVGLLEREKRHQYVFNDEGQGCRYWTDHQMTLFQTFSLVGNQAQVAEARAAILTQYPDNAQYPLVVGTYYP